jgi:hypothetical protein
MIAVMVIDPLFYINSKGLIVIILDTIIIINYMCVCCMKSLISINIHMSPT